MKLPAALLRQLTDHAIREYPREACGLIIMVGRSRRYVPCNNVHPDTNGFAISKQAYAKAAKAGKIVAVFHSHPDDGPHPSPPDMAGIEGGTVPWIIVAVHKDGPTVGYAGHTVTAPTGHRAPLIGRPFFYGVYDCWTLVHDWYAEELGIELPALDRGHDGWWNEKSDFNPYESVSNMKKAGFVRIEGKPTQRGDVAIMTVRSPSGKPNHAGVITDAETNTMLHHMHGQPSAPVFYGDHWRNATVFTLRHKLCLG